MIFILNFAAIARRHSLFDIECLLLISVQPWSPGRLAAYFIICSAGITRPTLRLGITSSTFFLYNRGHLSTGRPKFPRNYRLSSANHSAYEVAVSYSRILCSSMPEGSSGSILEAKSASIISHVGGHGNSTIFMPTPLPTRLPGIPDCGEAP